ARAGEHAHDRVLHEILGILTMPGHAARGALERGHVIGESGGEEFVGHPTRFRERRPPGYGGPPSIYPLTRVAATPNLFELAALALGGTRVAVDPLGPGHAQLLDPRLALGTAVFRLLIELRGLHR